MRQPTPKSVQYDWWSRTIAGERVPRVEDEPQPGFYCRRMVRGGPFVPVEIWLEQEIDPSTGELTSDEKLMAIRNGERANPYSEWLYVRAISSDRFDALMGISHTLPDMAATHVAVELGQMAALRP